MADTEPDDAELVRRFEAQAIPLAEWHHRDHVRVAWNYLATRPFDEALAALRAGIRKLNAVNQVPEGPVAGYHETVTEAWARLLADHMRRAGAEDSSAAFLAAQPHLGQRTLLRCFYSRERICSPAAKAAFVQGDLAPLPPPPPAPPPAGAR